MDFNLLTNPKRWCFPAFIYALFVGYLVIVTLTLDDKLSNGKIINLKDKILAALGEILVGIIVLYLILICCKNGYEILAWLILLLPFAAHIFKKK